ncbi:ADP/ATP carrier protein (macronuclear) [Tetrahymena thermophila SB210]|uniref:ADP/ATP translocase n=1 Tax=Tetrahymena thermophila (strain SB210) TaxID=312017 RepID=Q225W9_TETTS|nr:ADP/ATP carrier protein [Tetrahymena thermophila SB210]EAR81085.1 ADP/ATP carrier protein [Tetrahymena thermophila SB210]|eukprot:XP_001028748.1 ADP/ATP carrier protein [Tetrahymena thermophila SB210]
MSLWYPLEVARIKLTNDKFIINTQKKQYLSITDVCKQTLIKEGPNGLYRGYGISCFGMFFYRGLFFALSEITNKYTLDDNAINFIQMQFLLGWSIQFLSQLLTYPFYTISSRMIMSSGSTQRYTQSLQCIQTIKKQEGLKSLYRGVSINIFKSLGGASSFVLYTYGFKEYSLDSKNF